MEEAYSDTFIMELALGKKVKKVATKKRWVTLQQKIQVVTMKFDAYKANDTVLDYLRTLGHNVVSLK